MCEDNGRLFPHESSWSKGNCILCDCNRGVKTCFAHTCPELDCKHVSTRTARVVEGYDSRNVLICFCWIALLWLLKICSMLIENIHANIFSVCTRSKSFSAVIWLAKALSKYPTSKRNHAASWSKEKHLLTLASISWSSKAVLLVLDNILCKSTCDLPRAAILVSQRCRRPSENVSRWNSYSGFWQTNHPNYPLMISYIMWR